MKSLKKISIITAVFMLLFAVHSFAQVPTFAGSWKLKEKTLVDGKDFNNALAPFITFAFKGDSVKIKKAGDPANVKLIYQTTDRNYLPGKKQVTVNEENVTVQRYFNWIENKKSWELVTQGSQPGKPELKDYQFKDVWTYDAVSDVLRVDMTFKSESEPTEYCTFKAVYARVKP